jgi:hypothetical protein
VELGQRGEYVVWGFKPLHQNVYTTASFCVPHVDRSKENIASSFFEALKILEVLHLVTPVTYLVDSDSEHGEEMYPISLNKGEECEIAVGVAAMEAASLMLTDGQMDRAEGLSLEALCPVKKHVADVQAVGIYRLRHRPHTEATKAWFAGLQDRCAAEANRFNKLISDIEGAST